MLILLCFALATANIVHDAQYVDFYRLMRIDYECSYPPLRFAAPISTTTVLYYNATYGSELFDVAKKVYRLDFVLGDENVLCLGSSSVFSQIGGDRIAIVNAHLLFGYKYARGDELPTDFTTINTLTDGCTSGYQFVNHINTARASNSCVVGTGIVNVADVFMDRIANTTLIHETGFVQDEVYFGFLACTVCYGMFLWLSGMYLYERRKMHLLILELLLIFTVLTACINYHLRGLQLLIENITRVRADFLIASQYTIAVILIFLALVSMRDANIAIRFRTMALTTFTSTYLWMHVVLNTNGILYAFILVSVALVVHVRTILYDTTALAIAQSILLNATSLVYFILYAGQQSSVLLTVFPLILVVFATFKAFTSKGELLT